MTIHIIIGKPQENNSDFITVYPVTQTGAKVTVGVFDVIWVEVNCPVGKDWVRVSNIHSVGFDPELTEGRYLFLSNQHKISVTLTGSYITIEGIKYYILSNEGVLSKQGKLNSNFGYTMAPAEKLFKITE
jgi:hypothetical protein